MSSSETTGGAVGLAQADRRGDIRVPAPVLRQNVERLLGAWGMPAEHASASAMVLVQADLFGIESHGVSMLAVYEGYRDSNRLVPQPTINIERETLVSALVDGGNGLGHYPSLMATDLALARARQIGVGVVCVRNSNHFGAAGVYALRLAREGFLGLAFTSVGKVAVVPTHGRQPMFGTNPIAFAAPARRNRPFLLDMATSTAAVGKLMVAAREGRSLPPGWALGPDGTPETDPTRALERRFLLPLGGVGPETGSHKGYGLAALVEILTSVLAGGTFAPLRPETQQYFNVGHMFLALDPGLFRARHEFEDSLDALIDALHESEPSDPQRTVRVAGDPEFDAEADRTANGIPVSSELHAKLEGLFTRAGLRLDLGAAGTPV